MPCLWVRTIFPWGSEIQSGFLMTTGEERLRWARQVGKEGSVEWCVWLSANT